MEIPEALSDAGAAYLQDIRSVVPFSALTITLAALVLSLTRAANDFIESGIWIVAGATPIAKLTSIDGGIWTHLSVLDAPLAFACAGVALLISSIYRKIVFWALASSKEFRQLEASQHIKMSLDTKEAEKQLNWIDGQIAKSLPNLKKKDMAAELLCGVAASTIFYGNLGAIVDFSIVIAALITAYIYVQSCAKDYLTTVYPYFMLKANLAGLVHHEPRR